MKSSEYTEEIPRKHKIGFPRNFFGIYRRNSEEISIPVGEPLGDFTKFRGHSDESAVSVGISSSVPKKKGRLVGLGRRTRSVPPSSAPPPFVDPEVLTAQLKDKDDRISLLETQMAAQQAGYEAQRRLNQQMMEMMQRMYPNEVFPDVPDP
ncbi:hypothetical protein DY000_02050481 [Brassica cretica]|uniref:Uncharacterized protein n=1 Tax=Brassica cretica TaxID=69181 RepID=A0ABQ7EP90_BRACR|nr:hypothetical protein DY000_02050481 [Brassica cretica]